MQAHELIPVTPPDSGRRAHRRATGHVPGLATAATSVEPLQSPASDTPDQSPSLRGKRSVERRQRSTQSEPTEAAGSSIHCTMPRLAEKGHCNDCSSSIYGQDPFYYDNNGRGAWSGQGPTPPASPALGANHTTGDALNASVLASTLSELRTRQGLDESSDSPKLMLSPISPYTLVPIQSLSPLQYGRNDIPGSFAMSGPAEDVGDLFDKSFPMLTTSCEIGDDSPSAVIDSPPDDSPSRGRKGSVTQRVRSYIRSLSSGSLSGMVSSAQ